LIEEENIDDDDDCEEDLEEVDKAFEEEEKNGAEGDGEEIGKETKDPSTSGKT
jgi:hypothetical protein